METTQNECNMKKLLVIGIVLLALISCEKDDNQITSLEKDYLPLQVGNQWEFELAGTDSIVAITEMNGNGNDYFKFVNDEGTTSYYRKEGERIYVKLSSSESTEEMKFNLSADVDETWEYGPGYVTLVSRNATITIGDKQIEGCLQFNFHNNDLIDYGYTIWLAPGIGFIQQTCQECYGTAFSTMQLEEALVNDKLIEFK